MMNHSKSIDLSNSLTVSNSANKLIYKGPFEHNIIVLVGKNIDTLISGNETVRRKIYNIYFELAQNVAYYSAKLDLSHKNTRCGSGAIIISELNNHYYCITRNCIKDVDAKKFVQKVDHINSLSRDTLRVYKREQINLPPGQYGQGNIGLIKVALVSSNTIQYAINELNKSFYLTIAATINKNY